MIMLRALLSISVFLFFSPLNGMLSLTDQLPTEKDYRNIPTLKHLALAQVAKTLVEEDNPELLRRLQEEAYPDAQTECAHIIAEQELRVLLWRLFPDQLQSAQVGYRKARQSSRLPELKTLDIAGAAFSPGNRFLIIISSQNTMDGDWVAHLWDLLSIDQSMRKHASPAHYFGLNSEEETQLMPVCRFVIAPKTRGGSARVAWHPSSRTVAVALERGDTYILTIDNQASLNHQSHFTMISEEEHAGIPYPKEEKDEYLKTPHTAYVYSIEFDTFGENLLLTTSMKRQEEDLQVRKALYCLDLTPEQLSLHASCIAKNILRATWYPDGRILYIDYKSKDLCTINTQGTLLSQTEINSHEIEKNWFKVQKLTILPEGKKVLIRSAVELYAYKARQNKGYRSDLCELETGKCQKMTKRDINTCFLSERYGFKAIHSHCHSTISVDLHDLKVGTCATIFNWGPGDFTSYFSPDGSYIFAYEKYITAQDIPRFEPSIICLKTPQVPPLPLTDLLVLAKMNTLQKNEVLNNETYKNAWDHFKTTITQEQRGYLSKYFKQLSK